MPRRRLLPQDKVRESHAESHAELTHPVNIRVALIFSRKKSAFNTQTFCDGSRPAARSGTDNSCSAEHRTHAVIEARKWKQTLKVYAKDGILQRCQTVNL
jgi:hypothetical protein